MFFIRETQIKITVRYDFTPTRTVGLKQHQEISVGEDVEN